MKNIRILFLGITLLAGVSCKEEEKNHPKKPNIVVVLADDLGYGDPQVYNDQSKVSTPNIDRLAASGIRFTDAHTPSSVCTPTRYGLLTGRYAWRSPLKEGVLWQWDQPLIDRNRLTLPKMLKKEAYTTACIGKWHLGWRWPSNQNEGFMNDTMAIGNDKIKDRNELYRKIDFSKPLGGGPLEAGFDYYFGDDVPNFAPYTFIENDSITKIPNRLKPQEMYGGYGPMAEGWDLTQVMPTITEKAVGYIKRQAKGDQPFFLYFALTAPHTPIAPTQDFKGKSGAGAYGDFVQEVDWSVGKIVEALRSTGQLENTLIIFTSDNGSPQRDGTDMGGMVGSVKKYGHDPSRPWKGMKADIWEGGHRVPFMVSWPQKIPSGTQSKQLACLTDIMPSIASILNIPVPPGTMEDGFDISPILFGNDTSVRPDIVHHAIDGTFAIRKGDWKLILGQDSGGFSKALAIPGIPVETAGQLYNVQTDPSESNNLYAENPQKVAELTDILDQYKNNGYSHKWN